MANLANRLRSYLEEHDSPLAAHVPALIQSGRRYRVDPRLIVAIANAETSLGTAGLGPSVYNAWGIGPGRAYQSWQQGIDAMAKLLRTGYLNDRRTSFTSLYPKYVWGKTARNGDPEADWVRNASSTYADLGGNPANVTGGWRNASAPGSTRINTTPVPPTPGQPLTVRPGDSIPDAFTSPSFALSALSKIAQGRSPTATFREMLHSMDWAAQQAPSQAPSSPAATPRVRTPSSRSFVPNGEPVPSRYLTSVGGEHETSGLPGFPAHDYMAPANSPTIAPVSGTVIKLSGHNPRGGPTQGPHGPFGWSVYIKGDDGHTYYLTHLGTRNVTVGQKLRAGDLIGTVGNYARWGGANHIHMGVD